MLNTPKILGFSMVRQKNRRLLVAATYVILLVCVTTILNVPSWGDRIETIWFLFFPFIYVVTSSIVFGKLVKSTVFTGRPGDVRSLGLASRIRDLDEPDERDVAIRNAAHYQAFRAAGYYGLLVWGLIPCLRLLSVSTAALFAMVLILPLLTILWTLPQAIILWTEPEVPEEIKV